MSTSMPIPPVPLVNTIDDIIARLLSREPTATMSEAYIQTTVELGLLHANVTPRYILRIGINYRGALVQHLAVDSATRQLVGWNPGGDALATGPNAKVILAGATIFPRRPDEHVMTDAKIGGGPIPTGQFIRIEFKVRGWLGKTKNLDGGQLEKDLDFLKDDNADLLIICLSETAHLKWRGAGPAHQAVRRTGTDRFVQILLDPASLPAHEQVNERDIRFEHQTWRIRTRRVVGEAGSLLPGAIHYVTMCWKHL